MNQKLPRISIITPSLNQGDFIEKSIRSVLDQQYPDLEYIIVDGGSTDQTSEIIQKYSHSLLSISEKDNGQTQAINKGLRQSTGDILAFLSSDDIYLPGALRIVGEYFSEHPDAMWLSGYCINIDNNDNEIRKFIRYYKNFWLAIHNYKVLLVLNYVSQPSTFWRRKVLEEAGFLDENLYFTMDYEYWLRLGRNYPLHVINQNLARFRIHKLSKSGSTSHKQFDEEYQVAGRYSNKFLLILHRIHRQLNIIVYRLMMHINS
jgi:glycosyltransferase involved in cell wall biosynthesis